MAYRTELIKSFINKPASPRVEQYYIEVFNKFEAGEAKVIWNKHAFIGGIFFLIYKKLYNFINIISLVLLILTFTSILLLNNKTQVLYAIGVLYFILMLGIGFFANSAMFARYKYIEEKVNLLCEHKNLENLKPDIMHTYFRNKETHIVWVCFMLFIIYLASQ